MHRMGRRSALAMSLGALVLTAGCGAGRSGSAHTVASAAAGQTLTVTVSLGEDGCAVSPAHLPDGPTLFTASNTNDVATSEFGIERNGVVLAENEDVPVGAQGSILLDLTAGSYQVICPRRDPSSLLVPVTVVHVARPALTGAALQRADALTTAVAGYRRYLAVQTAALISATVPFERAVVAGDLASAKSLYAAARVSYERIEPVAESFPDLDTAIDARRNDVPTGMDWAGFHRLEYDIYAQGSLTGAAFYAQNLLLDLSVLQARVATIPLQPAQLADGAVSLLDEVGRTKVTGEEERYSHLDLVDFQANVDGAQEAFTLLAPALADAGQGALAAQVTERFTAMDTALDHYRTGHGPTDFVPYTQVSPAQRRVHVRGQRAPLAQVPAFVA
jgi:iron uptake system component EfeO